jgi:hypothetical protein
MTDLKVFREDTHWAIASRVASTALAELARELPVELRGDGSKVVQGKDGFAALLVFGGVPDERMAKRLLRSATPVYLLDFDDDAPLTLELKSRKSRIGETRLDDHPAEFLAHHGIKAPGFHPPESPIRSAGVVCNTSLATAKKLLPSGPDEVELRAHPKGILVDDAAVAGDLADELDKPGYFLFRNPEDGWFRCVVRQPGIEEKSYSPVRPDPNRPSLDNILGETTLDGILRVLQIPPELLGL